MSGAVNVFIRALRLKEAALLSGFIIIGSVFGIESINISSIRTVGLLLFVSIGIISSLYALNAYSDKSNDKNNQRLTSLQEIPSIYFLWYFYITLPFFVVCAFIINVELGPLIVGLSLAGILYSLPRFAFKGNPILGTVAHFLFAIAAFNAGYAAFQGVNPYSIYLSCYFGLIFSGGHLHHQVIDYESDQKASVKTLAVWWGVTKTEFGSITLFGLAIVLWLGLFYSGDIKIGEFTPLVAAFLIQAVTFIRYRNKSFQDRLAYRNVYRTVYFLAFLLIALLRLWKL